MLALSTLVVQPTLLADDGADLPSSTPGSFHEHLEGMTEIQNPALEIFKLYVPDIAAFTATGTKPAATLICTGKLRRKDQESPYMRQFRFLASCVPPEEVKNCKITLAAPEWFHLRHQEHAIAKGAYDDEDEYYADIAKAYRAELAALYKIGCRNVQFDDPLLAYFCAVPMLEGMKKEGKDPEVLLDKYVKLYNDCLADKPNDLVVGLHLCRGNFKGACRCSTLSFLPAQGC